MAKVYSTQQALDMILNQVNPCDSDGEVTLDQSSDSEISSDEETSPPPEKRSHGDARLADRRQKTAQCGVKNRSEDLCITAQLNAIPWMEGQLLLPEEKCQVA
ncbi:hypothetical protein MHYP_G00002090 [Metynnis hypsauchen]